MKNCWYILEEDEEYRNLSPEDHLGFPTGEVTKFKRITSAIQNCFVRGKRRERNIQEIIPGKMRKMW